MSKRTRFAILLLPCLMLAAVFGPAELHDEGLQVSALKSADSIVVEPPEPTTTTSTSTTTTSTSTTTTTAPPPPPTTAPPTTSPPPPPTTAPPAPEPVVEPEPAPEPPPAPQGDIEQMIYDVFGDAGARAVQVARCESGLNPRAVNGQYRGLFQLGNYHVGRAEAMGYSWDQMFEAYPNIVVAHNLYAEQGWRPWSCA